jgi:hypothetical protein
MATRELGPFRGIDARPGAADQAGGLLDGLNVIVGADGGLVRRPALTFRATLPSDSKGIYAVGDQLRTIAPHDTGDETTDDGLAPIIYVDYITDPDPRTLDDLLGVAQGSDGRTVALLRYDNEATALHRCPDVGTVPGSATLVSGLGFTPDFSLMRAAGRAWVLDAALRFLRHSALDSATPEKLIDFTSDIDLSGGAGALEVSQFATGVGAPQGLGLFGERMVVFYRSAVLIYRIDVDKFRFFLEQQLTGPGCSAPRSVVELGADTIFLSDAGVRVLSTVTQTLDAREDAIGGRIDHLAKGYAADLSITPVGHYARRLGCYLLAFGQDVLCLGILPGSRILGWTRWRLPVAVDAWADSGGMTWMRSANTLYAFDDAENSDEPTEGGYVDVPVLVETLPYRGTKQSIARAVSAASTEPVRVQVIADGRPGVDISGVPIGLPITLPARAPEPARAVVGKLGRTFAVRVYDAAAQSGWRLDNLWIEVEGVR